MIRVFSNKKDKEQKRSTRGSLLEPMITALVLVVVLIGILQLFVSWLKLGETSSDLMVAMSEAKGKLEEIRNHVFDNIVIDYDSPDDIFNLTQVDGAGIIYIDYFGGTTEMLEVEIVASFRTEGDRIVGEDKNLDSVLDAGEDKDGDGRLSSTISLSTLITQR
ncbi:hypothetical protein ACFL96_07330 [Thermoproteota archaeon]